MHAQTAYHRTQNRHGHGSTANDENGIAATSTDTLHMSHTIKAARLLNSAATDGSTSPSVIPVMPNATRHDDFADTACFIHSSMLV